MDIRRFPIARHAGWLLLGLYAILAVGSITLAYRNNAAWLSGNPPSLLDAFILLLFGVWVLVGALLISRKPDNPIGWLFSIGPLLIVLDDFSFGYVYYSTINQPGSLPVTWIPIIWLYLGGHGLYLVPLSILLHLFPTGRPLTSSWGRWIQFSLGAAAVYILTAAIHPITLNALPFPSDLLSGYLGLKESTLSALQWVAWVAYFGMLIGVIASVASLLVRLTSARGVERQQLKWFVFAASFAAPGFSLFIVGLILRPTMGNQIVNIGSFFINLFFIPGIPIASAIAILRYRLFDIDIIIRRTLSYALLTGLLVLAYFLVIVTLQWTLGLLVGLESSPLITVISTLTIAALFNPLRHRIQDFIDRRFYRNKYDAERILARFTAAARDEVDLESLAEAILMTVEESLQPERTSLWLKRLEGG